MEKIGIIDLGSNSARLVIVELFGEGHFMVVDELKESVRLGQDMERDGFLKPQRVAETIKTLKMFKKLCDASKVDRIIAVATAAVRRAKNQRSFLDELQATCGIKVKVLSEEEEATLVYRGVINSMDIPKGIILEIGGGSTTIVYTTAGICSIMRRSRSATSRLQTFSKATRSRPNSRRKRWRSFSQNSSRRSIGFRR